MPYRPKIGDTRPAPGAAGGPKKRRRRGGLGRLILLSIVGGAIAIAVSEDLRNKVLDLLFGAEEEFDYTSTTTPSTPAPTETAGAST